jgi:hypothetical protein
MGDHFYGPFHWEFFPVDNRLRLLDALMVFCDGTTNLFIEVNSPSLRQRFRFWRMRSSYQTSLRPDQLSPRPSLFHLRLTPANLRQLRALVQRDGLDERSLTHLKGYAGDRGLFWFHGFCDVGDQTFACSCHVDESTLAQLETLLDCPAVKKFGELKTERQQQQEIARLLAAWEQSRTAKGD